MGMKCLISKGRQGVPEDVATNDVPWVNCGLCVDAAALDQLKRVDHLDCQPRAPPEMITCTMTGVGDYVIVSRLLRNARRSLVRLRSWANVKARVKRTVDERAAMTPMSRLDNLPEQEWRRGV